MRETGPDGSKPGIGWGAHWGPTLELVLMKRPSEEFAIADRVAWACAKGPHELQLGTLLGGGRMLASTRGRSFLE